MKSLFYMAAGAAMLVAMSGPAFADDVRGDVWVDNWFAFFVNDTPVAEDKVPITTERSFNSQSFAFSADRPYALNFIVKDFKENDSGLEYIGTPRQQMGDGGFIAQFRLSSGQELAVTSDAWRCLVIQDAPADESCAHEANPVPGEGACAFTELPEPEGWKSAGFDDSAWPKATEYDANQVGPKDGYNDIRWLSDARLVWGPDLHTNNTLLCRMVVR